MNLKAIKVEHGKTLYKWLVGILSAIIIQTTAFSFALGGAYFEVRANSSYRETSEPTRVKAITELSLLLDLAKKQELKSAKLESKLDAFVKEYREDEKKEKDDLVKFYKEYKLDKK
jgi:glutamine synthetase type III